MAENKDNLVVKKQGLLKVKQNFTTKERYIELDELNEYVSLYAVSRELQGTAKMRLVGTLSLEGATIKTADKKKGTLSSFSSFNSDKGNVEKEYCVKVRTRKGKKYNFITPSEEERDAWKAAFETAKQLALSSKQLIEQWNKEDPQIRSVVGNVTDKMEDEEEEIKEDEADISYFDIELEDPTGKKVQLKNVLKGKATVVMLLRHFGCMLCRYAVGRMSTVRTQLEKLGIEVIAIGNGTPEMARTFNKEQHFTGRTFVDQDRNLYKALCCKHGARYSMSTKTLAASKTAYSEGFRQGPTAGNLFQLGGVFVISPEVGIVFQHVEQYAGHLVNINEMIEACKSFIDQQDKWSTRITKFRDWNEVENMKHNNNLIKINEVGYKYEFGNNYKDQEAFSTEILEPELNIPFYANAIVGKKHDNYISSDKDNKSLGHVIISAEEVDANSESRVVIRSKNGDTRVVIPPERDPIKHIKAIIPELATVNFLKVENPELIDDLEAYDHKFIFSQYKFGVLYMKEGQTTEEELYSNQETSSAYEEFLGLIGERIKLEGWNKFRGGLDVRRNTTGLFSVFSTYKQYEVMFHVATMLPFQVDDLQRVERKRHLGNDVVLLIFKEKNAVFDPQCISSQFNNIFIVVEPSKDSSGNTEYKVSVAHKSSIPPFSPLLPYPAVIKKNQFHDFILSKMINAERATMHSPDFFKKMQRTRKEILKEISDKYDSSNKRRLTKTNSTLRTSSPSASATPLPGSLASSMKKSPSDSTLNNASDADYSNTLKPELSKSNNSSSDSLTDHLFVPTLDLPPNTESLEEKLNKIKGFTMEALSLLQSKCSVCVDDNADVCEKKELDETDMKLLKLLSDIAEIAK